jgi:nicotinate-nucleotide adenylyltransferase
VVSVPLIEIGSTDIRKRVAEERSIDYLTPPEVVKYIHEHGLYRAATGS